MHYAKEHLGLGTVLGITSPNNQRSIRLLQKIGLRYDRPFRFQPDADEVLLFTNAPE